MNGARLAWDLLRAEGARGLAERLAERIGALKERLEERSVRPEQLAREAGPVPVLDVLATPFAPRFGGVPVQLGARRAEEARLRPTALLAPESGSWTLRATRGGEALRARLGPVTAAADPSVGLREGAEPVLEAARLVGAGIVNVEGVSGWPPAALGDLAGTSLRLVVSLHDFALCCPRPNLVELPRVRFCGFSRDAGRCRACLAATWSLPEGHLEGWRRDAKALLAAADAVVYPSEYLRRQHAVLFPGVRAGIERVLAPPAPGDHAAGPVAATRHLACGEAARVAFVGASRPHQGALVFEELVRSWTAASRPVRWSILGSGEPALARRARAWGIRVEGHYRAGSLARRLREEEVDVALLLSIWPETFGLTLSECRSAGVPVVAFAHGAIAERVAADGGGLLVPPEDGAAGVGEVLESLLSGTIDVPPLRGEACGLSPDRAALERTALYRTLLGTVDRGET